MKADITVRQFGAAMLATFLVGLAVGSSLAWLGGSLARWVTCSG